MGSRTTSGTRRLVVAHPSTELYGADLQMLESVRAALAAGWTVTLVLPADGPLAERAHGLGADVVIASFPVLRKSLLSPRGLVGLAARSATALVRAARFLRSTHADVLYVSTVTIPVWLAAARLARVPSLCHVHEAEEDQPRAITAGLTAPLLLADALVANGVVPTRDAAFARLLRADGPYHVPHYAPDAADAVRAIVAAGGVPVFAHPGADARGRIVPDETFDELAAAGLVGLEVHHRDHSPAQRERLTALAGRLGLLVTGGSDYHGAGKLNELGENLTRPETLAAIEERGTSEVVR